MLWKDTAMPMHLTNLRAVRIKRLLTQEELAQQIAMTPVALSRLENGKTRPHISTVRKLIQALEVSVEELTGELDQRAA